MADLTFAVGPGDSCILEGLWTELAVSSLLDPSTMSNDTDVFRSCASLSKGDARDMLQTYDLVGH